MAARPQRDTVSEPNVGRIVEIADGCGPDAPARSGPVSIGAMDIENLPPLQVESPRVVSVSPAVVERTPAAPRVDEEIILAPQNAGPDANKLRQLVNEACHVARQLEQAVKKAGVLQQAPVKGAAQLQERLRLGARMLKAFQGQIDRVEKSVGELREHHNAVAAARASLDDRLAEIEVAAGAARVGVTDLEDARTRADEIVVGAVQRLESHVEEQQQRLPDLTAIQRELNDMVFAAIERVEAHVVDREQRLPKLEEFQTQVTALVDRELERFAERLKAQDQRAGRLDELIERLQVAEGRMDQFDAQRTQGEQLLTRIQQANAGAARTEHLTAACAKVGEELDARLAMSDAASERLDETVQLMHAAAKQVEPVTELCRTLEHLLGELEPWRLLLAQDDLDADGVPRPVSSMIETLRTGIGQDMANLSTTMRDLAQRVDEIGLPPAPPPPPPPPPEVVVPPAESKRAGSA